MPKSKKHIKFFSTVFLYLYLTVVFLSSIHSHRVDLSDNLSIKDTASSTAKYNDPFFNGTSCSLIQFSQNNYLGKQQFVLHEILDISSEIFHGKVVNSPLYFSTATFHLRAPPLS
ncbi:MAG: hypothetical protein HYS25_17175 [Ignavibacteriales bacterium]|nr:hypothetical protein [Ignavibacteriales bacterium]